MNQFNENTKEEIIKLIKFIKSMQTIIRTSPNQQQVERIKKDLYKYIKKLQSLVTDFDPSKESISDLERRILNTYEKQEETTKTYYDSLDKEFSWEDLIPIKKASPHCNDLDINFIFSTLDFILKEFWPVLSEQHIQLDFTHSQERQSIRLRLDDIQRELKTLLETIEDYALTESADFRDQLYKMKNKQIRLFLININEFYKLLRDFLKKLLSELDKRSGVIKNSDAIIKFNKDMDESTLLDGSSIRDALTKFLDLVQYILKKLLSELDKRSGVIKNSDAIIKFNKDMDESTLLDGSSIRDALTKFLDLVQYILKKINLPDLKQKKF